MSVTQAAGSSVPGLVLGDARQDSAMNDGPSPSVEVEMSDAAITPNDPSVAPSAALVKAETPAPRQSSPGRLTPEHPVKHEPSATSTMLPRPATPPMPIRARTRSTSPVSGPGSVATGPSMDDKPSASAGTSASPPRDGMDGRSGSAGSGGSEVDKAKLLATIEMTKKANLLQQRLALAGFKAQHGWAELSLRDIEPKLATVPPPAPHGHGPGLALPATPLRKRKSHSSLSIASPTDREVSAAGGAPFRSPSRGSFPQGSPLRAGFGFPVGPGSPTAAGFPSPGARDRRPSTSGRPRVAYVSPHRDRRPSGSFAEHQSGNMALQPSAPVSPTSPNSPRKRSRTGTSPGSGSPPRSAQHRTFLGAAQNGTSPYARRGSGPSRSPSPPILSKRYAEQHRRAVAVPYGLDYVAEEQGNRLAGRQSASASTSNHRRVISTSGSAAGHLPPANGRHLHPLAASPSLPPPRSYREEHRKKQRSQSHSGFHLLREPSDGLPPSTDAMDVDAANALTSMLGSGSSRGNSPAFSPTASFAVPHFPDSLESAPISPASNLALRNSVAAQKPRSQSFAAMSRKFSGSGSPSPSLSHARPTYTQAPSSNARGGHSGQQSRRPSDDAALDDQESEDEAKEAAELMIFLAQSPSPARNVARKHSAQHLSGTPGGVGRVLFEESTGTHAGDTFSPSRFANLMIQSPRDQSLLGREQAFSSVAGDRMRLALESGRVAAPKPLEPAGSENQADERRSSTSQAHPHSAATSVDSDEQPLTPTSSAVRSHEGFSTSGVKA